VRARGRPGGGVGGFCGFVRGGVGFGFGVVIWGVGCKAQCSGYVGTIAARLNRITTRATHVFVQLAELLQRVLRVGAPLGGHCACCCGCRRCCCCCCCCCCFGWWWCCCCCCFWWWCWCRRSHATREQYAHIAVAWGLRQLRRDCALHLVVHLELLRLL